MLPLIILASVGCAVVAQLRLKAGMNRVGRITRRGVPRWRAGTWALASGLALYGVSAVLWLFVLSRAELSYAFPFLSLSYVAILIGARWSLGESLGPARVIGSVMIVVGVLLVSLS